MEIVPAKVANLPNLNARVHPEVHYYQQSQKVDYQTLNLNITTTFSIIEIESKKEHKLVNGTRRFEVKSDELITSEVIYLAFKKSFENVYVELLKILLEKGLPRISIKMVSNETLNKLIIPIIDLFNGGGKAPIKIFSGLNKSII